MERHAELNTFMVFNKRRRVTSSAKRKRVAGSLLISQTPDGSFLDLMRNSAEVLHRCGVGVPLVSLMQGLRKPDVDIAVKLQVLFVLGIRISLARV